MTRLSGRDTLIGLHILLSNASMQVGKLLSNEGNASQRATTVDALQMVRESVEHSLPVVAGTAKKSRKARGK